MALVRKSNTRRNLVMIAFLSAAIIGGGVWLYLSSQPVDLDDNTDGTGGSFRDISAIRQFNSTDFSQSGVFNRSDYQSLTPHGTLPTEPVTTGVINPFVPSQ